MLNPLVNDAEGRFRTGMRILSYIILLLIGLGILALAIARTKVPGLLFPGMAFLALGCTWLAAKALDKRPFPSYGFGLSPRWWLESALGIGLGAILMGLIFLLSLAAGWISLRSPPPPPISTGGLLRSAVQCISLAVMEGIVIRGYFFRNLAEGLAFPRVGKKVAALTAWILSGIASGIYRAGQEGSTGFSVFTLCVFGLVLGLPLLLDGQLALSLGLQAGWNFFQGSVFGFSVSGITELGEGSLIDIVQGGAPWLSGSTYGPEAGLIGLAACLAGAAGIICLYRLKSGIWFRIDPELGCWKAPPADEGSGSKA